MSVGEAEAVFDEFKSDIRRTRDLISLVKKFRGFAGESVPDSEPSWPMALALHSTAGRVRTELPILSASLLLYACGSFENCIKKLLEVVIEDQLKNASNIDDLTVNLKQAIIKSSLEVAKSPSTYSFLQLTDHVVLTELGQSLDPSVPGVNVRAELVTLTTSNMRAEVISDLFKKVDIDFWSEATPQAALKRFLTSRSDKECRSAATSRLDEIMRLRNSLAHPNGNQIFPDIDIVQGYVDYLEVLAMVAKDIATLPR
ncbi:MULTISPECIES: HEPN domain-containing protein [unclassified Streptomyces]